MFRNVPFSAEWNCILLFQVEIRISRKDLSSVSGEYSKKIPEKSFDIFGTIKTIGLRERIHSHDQSKREAFSRTVSYKEEIHFIIRSKLYRFPYVFLKRNKTKQNDYKKKKKGSPGQSLTWGLRRVMVTHYQSVQFLLFPSFWAYFYFLLFLHYKKTPIFPIFSWWSQNL